MELALKVGYKMQNVSLGRWGMILETHCNLATISERSSPQPLAPQVLQTGRKCEGELEDVTSVNT